MLSYPMLFTGGSSGSKTRGKKPRVDEMDEEFDPTMEEVYGPSVTKSKKAAPKKKAAANKNKHLTASEMSDKDYTSMRKRDPYAVDRVNLTPQFRRRRIFPRANAGRRDLHCITLTMPKHPISCPLGPAFCNWLDFSLVYCYVPAGFCAGEGVFPAAGVPLGL